MASNKDQISYKAGETKGQAQEKVGHGTDAVKGNAEGAKENTGNFFTNAKDKVSEAAQGTKDKITGAGQATKDKTSDTAQAGKDKVSGGDSHY